MSDKKTGLERYLEQRMKDPEFAAAWAKENTEHDPVNAPEHYTRLDPEPIDVIEDWGLSYYLGNAVKYISRAGYKGDAREDLSKAVFYLQREIARLARQAPEIATWSERMAEVLDKYPRERPQVTVEPGDNPDCEDRGNYDVVQPGDCSTVSDDEECSWQSQACDSCKGYYGIGKSHS